MSVQVTCEKCGARLTYKGTARKVKPCPKCQTPIAFAPAAIPPTLAEMPEDEEPIEAHAVAEAAPESSAAQRTSPNPTAAAVAPLAGASAPSKNSPVVLLIAGGLTAALALFTVLLVSCAGIMVFVWSSDGKESLAADSTKGSSYSQPYSDYGKAGDYSTYSTTADPYSSYSAAGSSAVEQPVAAGASEYTAPGVEAQPESSGYGLFSDYSSAEEEAAAQAEWESRWETQQQLNSDYWSGRASQAEASGNSDEADRYRSYSENP
jgi:hypothetical protein